MLKLRDFLHLPQLDQLMNRLVTDNPGLILYSDGLSDVLDESGSFMGLARLQSIIEAQAERPLNALCDTIFASLALYRGQAEQFDDMTLLALDVSLL